MNEETDLRTYINALLRHWWLIVAGTLLAAVAGLVVSLLLPAKYETTAIVLVTSPQDQFRLSSDNRTISNTPAPLAGRAAMELAMNDSLLESVLSKVGSELPPDKRNLYSLRQMLRARIGADTAVINLTATTQDSEKSAILANTWADLFVKQVNDVYGKPQDQSQFYTTQLAQAESDVKEADQALVNFQEESELAILEAQLVAKQKALADYLMMNESLVLLEQDVKDLQDQLARRPAGSPSNLGDELAQLILQVSILSARSNSLPLQLQLPSNGSLSEGSVDQQVAYLDDLANTIASRRTEVQKQTEALQPEIKALQGRIEATRAESERLLRQRDLAYDVHTALALMARETSITAQAASGSVRLISSGSTPDRPASRNLFTTIGLSLALGFLAVVGAILIVEQLRKFAIIGSDRPKEDRAASLLDVRQ